MPRPKGCSRKARKERAARLRSSKDRAMAKLRKFYGILPRKEQEALDKAKAPLNCETFNPEVAP